MKIFYPLYISSVYLNKSKQSLVILLTKRVKQHLRITDNREDTYPFSSPGLIAKNNKKKRIKISTCNCRKKETEKVEPLVTRAWYSYKNQLCNNYNIIKRMFSCC